MNTVFNWKDSDVMEFAAEILRNWEKSPREVMEQFKASKRPKREWEILKYRVKRNGYIFEPHVTISDDVETEIYSVKRLSDGIVFTLNDKINHDYLPCWEIGGFQVSGDNMVVESKNAGSYWEYLKDIKHAVPSLITQDNVAYYAGNKKDIYCVNEKGIDVHPEYYDQLKGAYQHFFSTKEKAEEYCICNKKLFSYEEIRDVIRMIADNTKGKDNRSYLRNRFFELAKDKLNLK